MARESFKPRHGNTMQQLPPSVDALPEQVTIDLDSKEPNKVVVEIVDDTPEEDRGRPNAQRITGLEEEEQELRNVSAKVQKRIDRLRFEAQSQVREKNAAERERDAAVELVRAKDVEIERLRKASESGATALAASMKSDRETKLSDATRRLSQAHADGDADAIAKATSDIAGAQAELVQIAARTPRAPDPNAPPVVQPQAQPQRQQQAPQIKPNVAAWIAQNDRWFNKDKAKTNFAMSVHQTLMDRGVRDDSEEYTRELDKGLKAMYPEHVPYAASSNGADDGGGGAGVRPRRSNTVTEGGRDNLEADPSSRKVTLTQSEVSLANRLRVPLDKYAEQKRLRLISEKGGAQ